MNEIKGKPLLLLVDDNEELRTFVSQELLVDYNIMEAGDAENAFRMAQSKKPDIIMTDIVMPGLDGLSFVRLLKDDEALKDIPVMVITGRQEDELLLEGLMSGADDYIKKPFQINVLKVRLRNLLTGEG